MKNNSNILNELQEISPALAGINRYNVYSVNPAYFTNLPLQILKKINTAEFSHQHFTSVNPFKVREGYFENLPGNILNKIRAAANQVSTVNDELSKVAPLLNTISKTLPYSVPAGYFETIQPNSISEKQKAKVVTMSKKVRSYAAAAVITGLMAIGSYFIIDKNLTPANAPADNVNTAVKTLKDDEIINFLKTRTSENVASAISEKATPTREIKQQLKEMSDEELQRFIKEIGEPDEIEVDI